VSSGSGLGLSIFAGCIVHVLQTMYLGKQLQSTKLTVEVSCAGREWCYTRDVSCVCHLYRQWTPHSTAGDLAQDPCNPGEPSLRSSCVVTLSTRWAVCVRPLHVYHNKHLLPSCIILYDCGRHLLLVMCACDCFVSVILHRSRGVHMCMR